MTYEEELQLVAEQEYGDETDFDELDFISQNEIHDIVQGANAERDRALWERNYWRYYE